MILWLSLHAVDYVSLSTCYLMINIKKKNWWDLDMFSEIVE